MPEKFYTEDEVIVSVEDIDDSRFCVASIVGNMLSVWDASYKPAKPIFADERLMMDIVDILKIVHDKDRTFEQYDYLRAIVAKLKNCILELHKTGAIPDDCRFP